MCMHVIMYLHICQPMLYAPVHVYSYGSMYLCVYAPYLCSGILIFVLYTYALLKLNGQRHVFPV